MYHISLIQSHNVASALFYPLPRYFVPFLFLIIKMNAVNQLNCINLWNVISSHYVCDRVSNRERLEI